MNKSRLVAGATSKKTAGGSWDGPPYPKLIGGADSAVNRAIEGVTAKTAARHGLEGGQEGRPDIIGCLFGGESRPIEGVTSTTARPQTSPGSRPGSKLRPIVSATAKTTPDMVSGAPF